MIELRWVVKPWLGAESRILQYRQRPDHVHGGVPKSIADWTDWTDVPVVKEERE